MNSIASYMMENHRKCDGIFALLEEAAASGNGEKTRETLDSFVEEMERHFLIEETRLFPELQEAAPQASGPVGVMKMEHEEMRRSFREMESALKQNNLKRIGGLAESLLFFMQQHNMKEEHILYPMTEALKQEDRLLREIREMP